MGRFSMRSIHSQIIQTFDDSMVQQRLRYSLIKQKHNARAAIITNAVQIKAVVSSPPPVPFINDAEAFMVSTTPS